MYDLVCGGVGAGFLPCVLANANPNFVPVDAALPTFDIGVWVLTHQDLRDTARVRVVMAALGDALAEQAQLFRPSAPGHQLP